LSSSNSLQLPLVSAVIPTRNRPELVCRAVRSVLQQTYAQIEAVVVIDGPDAATVDALEALLDARVRIVALQENVGGSEARNVGVRHASGEWIALLDDDDEWLPEKIERQIKAIAESGKKIFFSATGYIDEQNINPEIQPKFFPADRQNMSEYLFCNLDGIGRRKSFLQTSTWMVSRDYLLSHPFAIGLKRNQDTEWLLRHTPAASEKMAFVRAPLSYFHSDNEIGRISKAEDWKYNDRWADSNRHLFTERSYAYFLLFVCARSAALQGKGPKQILSLARKINFRYFAEWKLMLLLIKRLLQSTLKLKR